MGTTKEEFVPCEHIKIEYREADEGETIAASTTIKITCNVCKKDYELEIATPI